MRTIRSAPRLFILVACCLGMGLVTAAALGASTVRPPAVAGAWYPASTEQLTRLLTDLTRRAARTPTTGPADAPLRALILPHAGYIYSGWTAAHAGRVLQSGQFDRVILMGPDHRVGLTNACISPVDAYASPLGHTALAPEAALLRTSSPLFTACPPQSDAREHSLEAVLPFLQHYLQTFELIPVVVGRCNAAPLAATLDPYLDGRTLLVVSSDLSHHLAYAAAVEKDRRTITALLDLDAAALHGCRNCACGIHAIEVLLDLAVRHQWTPQLLHYSNSGDTAGGKDRVVGYAAVAFFGGTHMQSNSPNHPSFNEQQGRSLIRLAREAIARRLGRETAPAPTAPPGPFHQKTGTFVTLEKEGQLRGCIGHLSPSCNVWEGIQENAINAAFHDPRFSPLSADELDRIKISISVLTEPQPLRFRDGDDLIAKLRPPSDGVILKKGAHSATFLPQVWEQLPEPGQFLSHLCLKAGLSADAWQTEPVEVFTYQVQHFEEQ